MADLFPNLFKLKNSLIKQAVATEGADGSPDITASDPLEKFCGEIKGPASGSIRYVLKMSVSTCQNQYLKSGGGQDFIDNLTDEQVELISNDIYEPENLVDATIVAFSKGYSFNELISGNEEVVVLLDVPTHLSGELETAKMNPKKARDALTSMMNHKYYVMSIYISKAKKIAQAVTQKWNDLEDLTKVLNPGIILNYPIASERARMMDTFAKSGVAPITTSDGSSIDGLSNEDLRVGYKVLKIFARRMGARTQIAELMKSISDTLGDKK